MKKKRIFKIGIGVLAFILVLFVANVVIAVNRVSHYVLVKPYEELTFIEKVASKVGGYHFDTKQELIDQGLIYTDEQKEAKVIIELFNEIPELLNSDNDENIDEKIRKCEDVLDKLHQENSTGRIVGDNLINFMDDCISMTQNYKFSLEAYKELNVDNYKEYLDKVIEDFNKIHNDIDRFKFKKQ